MAPVAVTPMMAFALLGNLALLTHANEFLMAPHKMLHESVSKEDISASLLNEVEESIGKGSAANRVSQMEATLGPIVAALPKNEHGGLGHSAVRYALHRLFVLRHGWVIKGLASDAGLWNTSSPASVLKDQVPSFVENLFERRLAGKGFRLGDVAVLAATIEHLIHTEALSKLGTTFNLLQLPVTSPIHDSEASEVLDTYMMAYILGEDLNTLTIQKARALNKAMPEVFLAWKDTQKFVNDVRRNVTKPQDQMDFASLAKVAESVGEQFGSFQDFECRQMKDQLVNMEYRGTGRVRLSDFYKPALNGSWTFSESAGYLRSQGLLDESDPKRPSVMIANYVNSQTNCIASSGFYSVCCKNECENLLGELEEKIGSFEAKPASIISLVANMPSTTVAVPQKVSSGLLERLGDIAASHHGTVPLHGRLFAQWMHHVYPRECPYPHISGTADNKLPDEFLAESGSEAQASEEEMKQYVAQAGSSTSDSRESHNLLVEEVMPWSVEEELFVVRPQLQASAPSTPSTIRSVMLLAAAGSLAFGLIQTMQGPLGAAMPAQKKYVI